MLFCIGSILNGLIFLAVLIFTFPKFDVKCENKGCNQISLNRCKQQDDCIYQLDNNCFDICYKQSKTTCSYVTHTLAETHELVSNEECQSINNDQNTIVMIQLSLFIGLELLIIVCSLILLIREKQKRQFYIDMDSNQIKI
jgi:hypothetical protein